MSTTFTSAFDLSSATLDDNAIRLSLRKNQFAIKNQSGSAISYLVPSTSVITPTILKHEIKKIPNVYNGANIATQYRLPDASGKEIKLSTLDRGKLIYDGEDSKSSIAPFEFFFGWRQPDTDVFEDVAEYDEYIEMMYGLLRSALPTRTATISGVEVTIPRWSLLAQGIKDTVANMSD
jgi:hypothetical protein